MQVVYGIINVNLLSIHSGSIGWLRDQKLFMVLSGRDSCEVVKRHTVISLVCSKYIIIGVIT